MVRLANLQKEQNLEACIFLEAAAICGNPLRVKTNVGSAPVCRGPLLFSRSAPLCWGELQSWTTSKKFLGIGPVYSSHLFTTFDAFGVGCRQYLVNRKWISWMTPFFAKVACSKSLHISADSTRLFRAFVQKSRKYFKGLAPAGGNLFCWGCLPVRGPWGVCSRAQGRCAPELQFLFEICSRLLGSIA